MNAKFNKLDDVLPPILQYIWFNLLKLHFIFYCILVFQGVLFTRLLIQYCFSIKSNLLVHSWTNYLFFSFVFPCVPKLCLLLDVFKYFTLMYPHKTSVFTHHSCLPVKIHISPCGSATYHGYNTLFFYGLFGRMVIFVCNVFVIH